MEYIFFQPQQNFKFHSTSSKNYKLMCLLLMPKAISFHQVSFTFQQALLDRPKFTSSVINT